MRRCPSIRVTGSTTIRAMLSSLDLAAIQQLALDRQRLRPHLVAHEASLPPQQPPSCRDCSSPCPYPLACLALALNHGTPKMTPTSYGDASETGECYFCVTSSSSATRTVGAGGWLLKTKLSTNTRIPKTTNPHAAWLRIPTPIEIDMKATTLNARIPFICPPKLLCS